MTLADAARLAVKMKKKKDEAKQHVAERKAQKAAENMSDSEEEDMQNRQLQTNAFKKVSRDNRISDDSETDYDNPDLQLTTRKIHPLKSKPMFNMPRAKINFDLDQEEREIIAKADELSRE